MPQYYEALEVFGERDSEIQLRVKAPNTQNEPIQSWETASAVLAQLTQDGYFQIGNSGRTGPSVATIEAIHTINVPQELPKQGIQARGIVNTELSEPLTWAWYELELRGDNVNSVQTAIKGRLFNNISGLGNNATLQGAEFQVLNQSGSLAQPIGQATGLRAEVANNLAGAAAYLTRAVGVESVIRNGSSDSIAEAIAFDVVVPSDGTITTLYGLRIPDLTVGGTNFAIYTGDGIVRFGDALQLENLASTSNPPSGHVRFYARADRLYAKNSAGTEFDLMNSGSVTSVGLAAPAEFTVTGSPITASGTITLGKANQNATYVYSGPISGGAAVPTFRALVATDIPNLDANKISTGVFNNARINWAAPAAIGNTTPATGSFTTLTAVDYFALIPSSSSAYVRLKVGQGRTGNGYTVIDLISDSVNADFGLRLFRNNTGQNASSEILHVGTGPLRISALDAANIDLCTNNIARLTIGAGGVIGFFGATPVARPTVTGSKGGNAALGSLLTALANLGLITDSTT